MLIDFGIIVDRDVIDYFPKGIVNSHFSLLPQWRGADPISFAVLSGQSKTGVSLMLIDEGMDTGNILKQQSITIKPGSTTPSLTDELIEMSNDLLTENLPSYLVDKITPRQQPHPDRATYSRKLAKEDGELDFKKPATVLEREVRAYLNWPKSHTKLAGIDVTITMTEVVENSGVPGSLTYDNKRLAINCSQDALGILKLKPAGKGAMSAQAFLAGYGSRL